MRKLLLAVLCLLAACTPARSQDYIYATGSPVYSTQLPIDRGFVNVNNGEIHIEIPLATKRQRGDLVLNEALIYDSRIWKIIQNGSSYSWQPTNVPSSTGGWVFSSGAQNGYVTSTETSGGIGCGSSQSTVSNGPYQQWSSWTWTDTTGTIHHFPAASTIKYGRAGGKCSVQPTQQPTATAVASDGSGYTLSLTNYTNAMISDLHGTAYYPGASGSSPPGNVMDRNGNYWSTDGNVNLIDTSGQTPVLVTTKGNVTYYDVLGVNGTRNRYTVVMTSVYFNTLFLQTGVTESSGSFNAIQSIGLPDGSSYQFTYDTGPTGPLHFYSGEMTSMKLPTGGLIRYDYTHFSDSFGNVNTWLNHIYKDGGTTTFTPQTISACGSTNGCSEKVTITSPSSNDTVYNFTLDHAAMIAGTSWISSINTYQGSAQSGTLLRSTSTSYTYDTRTAYLTAEGTTTVLGTYEVPTSITNSVTLNDIGSTSKTVTALYGWTPLPSSVTSWDFGSATPTSQTTYNYGTYSFPTSVVVKDGSGNQISATTYGYDESTPTATSGIANHTSAPSLSRGNRTSEHDWISNSSSTLTTTMAYYDTGVLLSATPPYGTTTYGYDSTDTYISSVTPPTPSSGVTISSSSISDSSTGLPMSSTDPNGTQTVYKNYDSLNRVQEVDTLSSGSALVGKQVINYESTTQTGMQTYQNTSAYQDIEQLVDGYGRRIRSAVFNGQGSNPWYQQDTCYDPSGHLAFNSYSYQAGGWGGAPAQVCSGAGDAYTYDALGRVTQLTHGDSTSVKYKYTGRATQTTDENGVSRITQVDAFGRTTIVCEISASTTMPNSGSPANCGTDIAASGFVTNYTYSMPTHTITITQGAQTRISVTDSLGRVISTTEPERGTTSYNYAYSSTAGLGLTVTRKRPLANQSNANTITSTTTQYDALGRVVSKTYTDGTPTKTFAYDQATAWGNSSVSLGSSKGRLTFDSVATSFKPTYGFFVYDPMGRITRMDQCLPSTSCGGGAYEPSLLYSYDWAGNLLISFDAADVITTYTYSPANEIQSITSSANDTYHPPKLVSNVVNGPDGPLSYSLGNGLSMLRNYDALGRLNGSWVCIGAPVGGCPHSYGFAINGRKGDQISNACDDITGECATYSYDDFDRLKSASFPGPRSFSYSYDRYGNRWSQNVTAGSGPQPQFTFNAANNQISGDTYDAAGNLTGDGSHTYTYDAEGNLTAVDAGSTAKYTYNAFNQRVRIDTGGISAEFRFNPAGQRASNWDGNTLLPTRGQYYWGATPIAYYTDHTHFQHQDWLGTARLQTSYNGAVELGLFSLPWGDGFSNGSTSTDGAAQFYGSGLPKDDAYHLAGLDHDTETNTDHAQFRNYSDTQGRWLSPDPSDGSYDASNPQSFNRYSYVGNNPLSFTDPTGQFTNGLATVEGCSFGPIGCGVGVAIDILADIGLGSLLNGIFGGGPSFHGSLHPRPASPDGSFGESLGIPTGPQYPTFHGGGLGDILGFGGEACEFGACGGAMGFQNGSSSGASQNWSALRAIAQLGWDAYQLNTGFTDGLHVEANQVTWGNWCGPGGSGSNLSTRDGACHLHDDCLDGLGLTWGDETKKLPSDVGQKLQACNQALCNSAGGVVSLFFQHYGNYTCH